jgi:biopolymer transport protein ExbD
VITRPLDLASRLRSPPPEADALFYVNVVLLAFFFTLFGSRFVLSPGLEVMPGGFELPVAAGATAGARPTDVYVAVNSARMIMVEDRGVLGLEQLKGWLVEQARNAREGGQGRRNLRLLVLAGAGLPTEDFVKIHAMATAAGFAEVQLAVQPPEKKSPGGP